MDFTAELLARLQGGENVDDLAKELTKAINDASVEHARLQEQKLKEAEAQRKADEAAEFRARELARDKADAIDSLLIALEKIVMAWGLGDELIEVIEHINPDDVVQEMDKIKDLMDKYDELFAAMAAPKMKNAPDLPATDPIQAFLDKYVR